MIKSNVTISYTQAPVVTQIHFGAGLLYSQQWLDILAQLELRLVVIADAVIQTSLVDPWVAFLNKQGIETSLITFPSGEQSKTREMKSRLEDQLFFHHCGSNTAIIAIGGGVTTDLVGYLASTFCRGIPLLSIPTTLLGMVDAVIGGKTGVNTSWGKNLIGTFYPAQHVLIDINVLDSLPQKEWRNGFAEIIKHGLIRSPELIHKLFALSPSQIQQDPDLLEEIIWDSLLIKKQVVETDFQETGYRRILNFGHTVGHALELIENYQIAHGEAVAIGMLVESLLSVKLGHLAIETGEHIESLLKSYGFPLHISTRMTTDLFIQALMRDKKTHKKQPRFVLLDGIGSPIAFEGAYCSPVEDALLIEVLNDIRHKVDHDTISNHPLST